MFPALTKLSLILVSLGEQVDPVSVEFIVLPKTQIDVSVAKTVDSPTMPALQNLSDVLRPVVVVEFFVLLLQLTISIVELRNELLFETGGLVEWLH